jgi:heterotetrameric sarcosine oxidase gamma subunit
MENPTPKYSPIFTIAQESGVEFVTQDGWQVPRVFSTVDKEVAAGREAVALADTSASGKIRIEGEKAESVLLGVWNVPKLDIGFGADIDSRQVFRLRGDLFFVRTLPGGEGEALKSLTQSDQGFDELVTVTDITHGRSELLLIGPNSAELLNRLCGLDFHPSKFPNLAAKQSSVAKIRQLILRHDLSELPVFALVGDRSLAAYLWETIMEAGRDLNIMPLGQAAIDSLR